MSHWDSWGSEYALEGRQLPTSIPVWPQPRFHRGHHGTEFRVVMTSRSVFSTCFFNFPVVKLEE